MAGLVVLGLAAGAIAWVGTYAQDSGVALTKLLAAGLNTVPPGILVLGLGTMVHGLLPLYASPPGLWPDRLVFPG